MKSYHCHQYNGNVITCNTVGAVLFVDNKLELVTRTILFC